VLVSLYPGILPCFLKIPNRRFYDRFFPACVKVVWEKEERWNEKLLIDGHLFEATPDNIRGVNPHDQMRFLMYK